MWSYILALKVSCLAKYVQDVNIELSTWEKLSTFKGKCAVNAVNLKCNLLTGPLANFFVKGWRTILKERALQQCTAT